MRVTNIAAEAAIDEGNLIGISQSGIDESVLEHRVIVAQKSRAWNHLARSAKVTVCLTESREDNV